MLPFQSQSIISLRPDQPSWNWLQQHDNQQRGETRTMQQTGNNDVEQWIMSGQAAVAQGDAWA